MKNKGFTLIELLAVIVILAIILAIAVPTISSLIKNSQINAVKANEDMLVRAAKNYIINNNSLLPSTIGDTAEITYEILQGNNFISLMKDPSNLNSNCNGYVLVTKVSDNEYNYNPYLKCGNANTINNSITDGLLGHYTFDDFQEPTTNLVLNSNGNSVINATPGNYKPGWDTTLHNDAITVSNWSTGYNGGVESPSLGYHGKWVYESNNENPMMYFIDENDVYGYSHRWLGVSQYLGVPSNLGITTGSKISVSWDQKTSVVNKGANVGLYHKLISNGSNSFESNKSYISSSSINQWERVSFTTTVSSDFDLSKSLDIYVYGNSGNVGKLWVDNVQLELKPYATPFVNGSRAGIVKDYSVNNNHATLNGTTTPTWLYDSERNSGVYDFNGTNIRLDSNSVTSISGSNPRTIMGWIKTRNGSAGTSSFTVLASHGIENTGNDFSLGVQSNKVAVGYWGYYTVGNTSIENNKWYHIAATYDGTTTRIYLNGVLDGSEIKAVNTPVGKIMIGNRANDVHTLYGFADNIRVYNRALSEEEINYTYQVEK